VRNSDLSYDLKGCPVCGSGDSTETADRGAIEREVECIWEFHARRLRQPTPPEFLADRLVFSLDPPVRLVSCSTCSHLYRNPREDASALERTYAESAPQRLVMETLFRNQRNAFRARVDRIRKTGVKIDRGLEVGCYVGAFLSSAADAGLRFEGIDVNADVAGFARARNLPAQTGTLGNFCASPPYDAIVIWNTFEQLPDVRVAAAASRGLLREGGLFVVRVPNGDFYRRWRQRLGGRASPIAERFLAHNNLLGFPYRQGFTESSARRLLESSGFRIIGTIGDTLFPISDSWTTTAGALDERLTKMVERVIHRDWESPWIEVYSIAEAPPA
jgi:SAM-dependent methyltransferase